MHASVCVLLIAGWTAVGPDAPPDPHPLPADERERIQQQYQSAVEELTRRIARDPERIELYSRRGDAYFFLADFKKAVADYDRMVALDPNLETSHWRRGIAYFYAGEHAKAARQFEVYHTFDNVDRENGIWRFLSQVKADGLAKAREGLLKYEKDDREPFPAVYRLFAGQTAPGEILDAIREAKIDPAEREKRVFYAQLYIGLNDAVEDQPEEALRHLREAVANRWGARPDSGYGPHYMWHVGRLHYELLARRRAAN
ncbi:MAG TPA: tetratricopeptide repeat protein [Planctomycetaceae bacterium]|nr:tetratricopeptide repeat protein [Planctomycetaceae bacterium]